MERRVSPRTKTRLSLSIRRGKLAFAARCIELSQTGLLAEVPSALLYAKWPYASARLKIDGAEVRLLLRRVAVRGNTAAFAITSLDDASQSRLTDYLFDVMHRALPRKKRLERAA